MAELGERLGAGKEAEVFAYGERVAKLYPPGASRDPAFREAANLAIAQSRGLPCPIVEEVRRFGDRWGLVMSRAPGRAFAETMRSDAAAVGPHLDDMVRLHRAIHAQTGLHLGHMKTRLGANIARAPLPEGPLRERLLRRLAALPDGDRCCHGDFHPFNVIGAPGAAIVVDWLDATCGPPAADVARSHLLMRLGAPEIAGPYVAAYAAASGLPAEEIMAWLPVLAAARLVENVPEEAGTLRAIAESA